MFSYAAGKILNGLLVLLGVVLLVFVLFTALPGDAARMTMGQRADVSTLQEINKEFGLDKPEWQQFVLYLNDLSPVSLHKNTEENELKYNYVRLVSLKNTCIVLKYPYLRKSYQNKKSVTQILGKALPNTAILAFAAIIFAVVLGISLGMIAALRRSTFIDRLIIFISVTGISLPSFFIAIIFQWLFAFVLHSITGLNLNGNFVEPDISGNVHIVWKNLFLPALCLGIRPIAIIAQLTRSSLLEVMKQDYIRTAKAKGLSPMQIIFKHALRNAINPVLTAVSGWFAEMLAGAFFIEIIFGWNGFGKVTVDALSKNDFPVVMGSVLVAASIFVVINLLTDILYGVIDPRIRLN
jgi:peptide/nickel transport system permease protein